MVLETMIWRRWQADSAVRDNAPQSHTAESRRTVSMLNSTGVLVMVEFDSGHFAGMSKHPRLGVTGPLEDEPGAYSRSHSSKWEAWG